MPTVIAFMVGYHAMAYSIVLMPQMNGSALWCAVSGAMPGLNVLMPVLSATEFRTALITTMRMDAKVSVVLLLFNEFD